MLTVRTSENTVRARARIQIDNNVILTSAACFYGDRCQKSLCQFCGGDIKRARRYRALLVGGIILLFHWFSVSAHDLMRSN